MQIKELFYNCYYAIVYQEVGDGVNYAFVEEGDTLYIYFEASRQITDWVLNFLFAKKVYKEFKVHRGFYYCYSQVRDIILNKVYSTDYNNIVIVGYSHGGSMVQLALEDLVYHFPEKNIIGYAFETPRCLKVPKKYRERWNTLIRIEDNWDLVAHVPPRLFGYTDLGTKIKVHGNTDLVEKKLPKCIKSHYPQVVLNGLEKYEQEKCSCVETGGKNNT